ncbi:gamma-glutamyl-gamma-aminobutyrate hydrolase family protein [Campylobacter volucris]|uniref:Gamma-glutamyl-gamma-aminobutyrate hydrolase family protein n=1 Tax=Campylobacter volucris TaxID=1031542 RepID=A0A5C7DVZ3_9BACT|nr:gamma-glutamyl-CDP-amidate hydrolase [Campylobacter volucris]TXE88344.1 gamma-glutamyl-gamma-aminobutyrate hydrolase family protein [Campylobacter volucris]
MKFIAISQRIIKNNTYFELRECLALEWGEFFNKNLQNFLPLPLSYEIDFKKYARSISAVILSGGNDLYEFDKNDISKKRDEYESNIIAYCIKNDLPLLGICRGAQMIASYFKSHFIKCENHIQNHDIYIKNKKINVNSFHNFAIDKLSDEFEILARANDNTIEAFKHKNLNIYGIMWHMERQNGLNEENIFKDWLGKIK